MALGNYEVGIYTDHAADMAAAYNSDPNHTPLELYQKQVADADVVSEEAKRDARNTYEQAIDGADSIDVEFIHSQAVNAANVAAAGREATANEESAYRQAQADDRLAVSQDAADAALYGAQETAAANLPANALAAEV